jgi:hypothetical protein
VLPPDSVIRDQPVDREPTQRQERVGYEKGSLIISYSTEAIISGTFEFGWSDPNRLLEQAGGPGTVPDIDLQACPPIVRPGRCRSVRHLPDKDLQVTQGPQGVVEVGAGGGSGELPSHPGPELGDGHTG